MNNLNSSFNGNPLNTSNFLASSNNNNMQSIGGGEDQNMAQKFMDGLLKNLQKKSKE